MTIRRIVKHVKDDVLEIGHTITHHHHENKESNPAISTTTSTASLFDKVQRLPNPHKDLPTGKFLAAADHLRRKFAKTVENHHFPRELANDFPAYEKLVRGLQTAVENEEKNRGTFAHEALQQRFTFLQSIVQSKEAALKTRLDEYYDQLEALTGRKRQIAELKALVAAEEPPKKSICGSSKWKENKSKFEKHAKDAEAGAKQDDKKAEADRPKTSSFHMNLNVNVKADIADIIGNIKKFKSSNDETSKQGAMGILKYHENKIREEEELLEEPKDLEIEEVDQLSTVKRKLADEESKHPHKLMPENMLAVIRVYEATIRILDKAVQLEKVQSHHSTVHLMNSFKHGLEKMLKAGGKFYCPAINDFDFNHFHNAFTLLKEPEAQAIISGDASEELLQKFMPQQPEYEQVAGVRL